MGNEKFENLINNLNNCILNEKSPNEFGVPTLNEFVEKLITDNKLSTHEIKKIKKHSHFNKSKFSYFLDLSKCLLDNADVEKLFEVIKKFDTKTTFTIDLSKNNITKIDIKNLENLLSLDCSKNKIESIKITNSPNIGWLNASYNNINNTNKIKTDNLEFLYLNNNFLTEFSSKNFKKLKELNLQKNIINKFEGIYFENLVSLNVKDNIISLPLILKKSLKSKNIVLSKNNFSKFSNFLSTVITELWKLNHKTHTIHYADNIFKEQPHKFSKSLLVLDKLLEEHVNKLLQVEANNMVNTINKIIFSKKENFKGTSLSDIIKEEKNELMISIKQQLRNRLKFEQKSLRKIFKRLRANLFNNVPKEQLDENIPFLCEKFKKNIEDFTKKAASKIFTSKYDDARMVANNYVGIINDFVDSNKEDKSKNNILKEEYIFKNKILKKAQQILMTQKSINFKSNYKYGISFDNDGNYVLDLRPSGSIKKLFKKIILTENKGTINIDEFNKFIEFLVDNNLNDKITSIHISHNDLQGELDISSLHNLKELHCGDNAISKIKFSPKQNDSLKILSVYKNKLKTLPELSNFSKLSTLYSEKNDFDKKTQNDIEKFNSKEKTKPENKRKKRNSF